MNSKSGATMDSKSMVLDLLSWVFGLLVFAIGVINTFWGNNAGFGIFLGLLSFVYIPPAGALFTRLTGFALPIAVKIILGIFIIWAALGVGELFDKIGLMMMDL